MKKLVILKLGGSLITEKDKESPTLSRASINNISREIKEGLKQDGNTNLIIIHGAGSYGHPIVAKNKLHQGLKNKEQLISVGETNYLLFELNNHVCSALINEKLPAFGFQVASCAFAHDKKLVNFNLESLHGLIKLNLIPVLYGSIIYDSSIGVSILSGDEIVNYLVKYFRDIYQIQPILFATDVDGIYTKDPKKFKNTKKIKKISSFKNLQITGSTHTDVTKGMEGKLKNIQEYNHQTIIFNGKKKGDIKKALNGERLGTFIEFS